RITSSPSTRVSSPSSARRRARLLRPRRGPGRRRSTKRDWPETSSDAQALLRGRSAGFQVRDTGNRPTPASVFGEANLLGATRQLTVNTPDSGFYGPGHASCGVSCKELDMATQIDRKSTRLNSSHLGI